MSLRIDPTPLYRTHTDPDGTKRVAGYAGCHAWRDESGAMKVGPYVHSHPETDVVRLLGTQAGAGELRLWDPVAHVLLPFPPTS